jgi:general secretion pathway protein K
VSPVAPDHNGSDPSERGFALLIVLWSLVLLAFLGSQMAVAGRSETQLAANLRNGAIAEAAADGAVHEALFHLLDSSNRHWRADGSSREVRFPNASVQLRIRSEAGKVNPNTASPELLQALLHAVGADQRSAASIAAAIAEWRFPDAQSRASRYRAMGHDYAPPGAPFETIGELGLVLGMTPELLARLSPHLSLYHDGEPDPAAADAVVLQAMRELGTLPSSAGTADESVVAIIATADGTNGTRFVRRTVVRLGGPDRGRPYRILTWDSGAS